MAVQCLIRKSCSCEGVVWDRSNHHSMKQLTVLFMVWACLVQGQESPKPTSWTSSDGKTIIAEFQKLEGQSVTLIVQGKPVVVPLDRLSAASAEQARNLAAAMDKPAPPAAAVPTVFQGMTLAPSWLPNRVGADQKFVEGLDFYCSQVVDRAQRAEAPAPEFIFGQIRWLMPLDEAVQKLGRVSKTVETRIVNQAFPKDSLTFQGFQGQFEDGGGRYNLVFLIADTKRQVVSVQLVAQTPKVINWDARFPPKQQEPYYDFINEKRNGGSGNKVFCQVVPINPGVKLVKTVLAKYHPTGKWLEDVHWYVPAPFAARFLDIVEHIAK